MAQLLVFRLNMTATQLQGEKALKTAEDKFRDWAASNEVMVARVLPLARFEESHPNTVIYIFFPTDSDLESYQKARKFQEIEVSYRKWLTEALYPMDRFPVTFKFISDQFIEEAWGGNIYNFLMITAAVADHTTSRCLLGFIPYSLKTGNFQFSCANKKSAYFFSEPE